MKQNAKQRNYPQYWASCTSLARLLRLLASVLICLSAANGQASAQVPWKIEIAGENLIVEFDHDLRSRVIARFENKRTPLGPFGVSESLQADGRIWTKFPLVSEKSERVSEGIGAGQRLTVVGKAGHLTKTVVVTAYDSFPGLAVFDVQYTNTGPTSVVITKWVNHAYTINAQPKAGVPAFWSYQSGSYEKRPNWVLPLRVNFSQKNYLGMNASDYGGGTPVVDVWRRDVGVAVGHVELRPKLVSLPVSMPDATHAKVAVGSEQRLVLKPGESFQTLRTFVAVHQGDYFRTLLE